ncbi:hypothetical protein EDD85DRAFT_951747 [Armillaria nabsnona]|nr:hypothetical protein EDD85DRAFT_951747 [Armillaria nabsnona]
MHKEAKDLALGFRCVVSRKYDQPTLSESTYLNEDSSSEELASGLAFLKSFCYVIEPLSGTKVHFLSNIITMQSNMHEWFTRLEIWFEKTDQIHLSLPPEITFTAPFHPRRHATCAKVIHFSGAVENTDKHDRVVEDLGVDESSAEVLSGALLRSMNQPIRLALNL